MSYVANLGTFIRVYELGSMSAAGRDQRISAAVASARIAELERHLGVRLFNRTTRSLQPTEQGVIFYQGAQKILDTIAEAEARQARIRLQAALDGCADADLVIEAVFLVAVVVLLAASVLLIANTIRLSIFSRRREIEVMKLVGATNWFVRGPFMLEGLLCGALGAAAAVVLLLLGKELALPAILGHIDTSDDVRALGFTLTALILLGVGLAVGAVGSGMTLRRYLKV